MGSQSTIKMEKGYYTTELTNHEYINTQSQSTIKMEKGYYQHFLNISIINNMVAIHNKNGQGLLLTISMLKEDFSLDVAIHNKNGQGLLPERPKLAGVYEVGVAIHNKNGQGLLPKRWTLTLRTFKVAIHNKNGQGLLRCTNGLCVDRL